MKIVQFVEAFGAGVYTYVKNLCNFLIESDASKRIEVYLIYSPNREEFNRKVFEKEIDPSVKLIEVSMHREINLKNDLQAILQTRKILKNINPDVIHLHSAKASVIGRIAAFNLVSRDKIFYSPHGYSFVQQNISSTKKQTFKYLETLIPIIFGGKTIASGDTEYIESKYIGESILIKNGVDLTLPNKIYKSNENKILTIGTIGRLSVQKNPSFFNKLALSLPQYNFIWIGDGELINQITAPNITITGWISTREKLLETINQLDIYTQVSLWEGLPISILEAMAMKKTLVVSNVIGNRDTVINNYNGFIYDNLNQAKQAIINLEDDDLRMKFSENSYIFCEKEFNMNNNLQKILNLYLQ